MSATIGKVNEFDPLVHNWEEYVEQLEQFFLANDIEDEGKKRAVLLSSCGSKSYSLFKNLTAPDQPKDKAFEVLKTLMKDHVNPTPSIIMQRFKFYKRDREPTENVATYLAELKKLSRDCDFRASLNDMLRDRLICGVRDDKIQQRLLSEANLTLDGAVTLATAVERAQSNLKDLRDVNDLPNVHAVHTVQQKVKKRYAQKSSFRCGKGHPAVECRFKNAECFVCFRRGHIATVCDEKGKGTTIKQKTTSKKQGADHVTSNNVEDVKAVECDDGEQIEYIHSIHTMRHKKVPPFNVTLKINGLVVRMEMDTGASLSIINELVF